MSTAQEVWGFADILTVEVDIPTFLKALNFAATDRGIKPNVPSDALDMSRDIMVDEAAHACNANWSLDGATLRLARRDIVVDWEKVAEIAEARP